MINEAKTINNIFHGIGHFFNSLKPVLSTIFVTLVFLMLFKLVGLLFLPLISNTAVAIIVFGLIEFVAVISFYVSVLYFRSSKVYEWLSIINYWAIDGYILPEEVIIGSLIKQNSGASKYVGRSYLTELEIKEIILYGLDNLSGPFMHILKRHDDNISPNRKVFIFKEKVIISQ